MKAPRDVLLIDDHDELREATRDLLEALGHRVVAAARPETADAGRFDVVVTSDAGALGKLLDAGAGVVLLADGGPAAGNRFGGRVRHLRKPFSAAELRAAVERAAAARSAPAPPLRYRAPATARRRPPAAAWGLAAAAVLVVASLVALRSAELMAPPLPEPAASTVRRGTTLELLAPVGEIDTMPMAFAWEEVPGAASYRARLAGVDGATLWEGSAAGGELPVAAVLHRGVVYAWEVEALDEDGRMLAVSASARFRVAPERERNE